jgi:hypothetical protein
MLETQCVQQIDPNIIYQNLYPEHLAVTRLN